MDKNLIRKDIESLIANIKEHFDNALDHDHIPQLELETIVSKIEKLHQKAIIFNFLNSTLQSAEKSHSTTTVNTEAIVVPPVQTDLFGSPVTAKITAAKPEPTTEKKAEIIQDIRNIIGINEKFQFINELFEGKLNEYNAVLDQLNSYGSFADAEVYLNSIKGIYNWDEEAPVVEKFFSLVRRKMS